MTEEFNAQKVNIIADILLPGDQNRWPSGGILSNDLYLFFNEMENTDRARISILISALTKSSPVERIALMESFEASQSELFERIYRWLLNAYYSRAEAIQQSGAIANAGPREASIHFDDRLVEKVIETQAGRYRR